MPHGSGVVVVVHHHHHPVIVVHHLVQAPTALRCFSRFLLLFIRGRRREFVTKRRRKTVGRFQRVLEQDRSDHRRSGVVQGGLEVGSLAAPGQPDVEGRHAQGQAFISRVVVVVNVHPAVGSGDLTGYLAERNEQAVQLARFEAGNQCFGHRTAQDEVLHGGRSRPGVISLHLHHVIPLDVVDLRLDEAQLSLQLRNLDQFLGTELLELRQIELALPRSDQVVVVDPGLPLALGPQDPVAVVRARVRGSVPSFLVAAVAAIADPVVQPR
mmetsp:Transcript_2130/g.5637  ORF Transcript_2130/g.5637 Transcript_2130/m.5637 type:complete len:269 (-) Transcript_2130:40-846(-)